MIMKLGLPKDCFCISLRSACLTIGYVIIGCASLIFVHTMTYSYMYAKWVSRDYTLYLMKGFAIEYGTTLQLIFSSFLLYGIYKEQSHFVFAWLLSELACTISFLTDFIFTSVLKTSLAANFVTTVLLVQLVSVTVFSYYIHHPKNTAAGSKPIPFRC